MVWVNQIFNSVYSKAVLIIDNGCCILGLIIWKLLQQEKRQNLFYFQQINCTINLHLSPVKCAVSLHAQASVFLEKQLILENCGTKEYMIGNNSPTTMPRTPCIHNVVILSSLSQ